MESAETRFLSKGYTATTVDEICHGAGTTKGAFFHHFRNKQEAALLTVDFHASRRFASFNKATRDFTEPRTRLLAYLDRMTHLATRAPRPACLVAALTMELSDNEPEVQARCARAFDTWTEDLVRLLEPVLPRTPGHPRPEAIAHHVLATFQGALVMSRATRNPALIQEAMTGARDYVTGLMSGARSPDRVNPGTPA